MLTLHRKSKKGFTLIELMIVVAIIGILAAIAIPNFLRFQLKSKTSEGKVNLAAIRTAEESYLAEFGTYVDTFGVAQPPGLVGAMKLQWPVLPATAPGFDTIGWGPEGDVFFTYAVGGNGAAGNQTAYTASAEANLDADPTPQAWGYAKPLAGARTNAVHVSCVVAELQSDNQVGPCDGGPAAAMVYGQSVF